MWTEMMQTEQMSRNLQHSTQSTEDPNRKRTKLALVQSEEKLAVKEHMQTGTKGQSVCYSESDSERRKNNNIVVLVCVSVVIQRLTDYPGNIPLLKTHDLTQPCKCNICNNKVDSKTKLPAHRQAGEGATTCRESKDSSPSPVQKKKKERKR